MPAVRTNESQLAEASGALIVREKALDKFELAPSDLDSILPVSSAKGVIGPKYNLRDVEALAENLKASWVELAGLAEVDGEQISHEQAIEQFKLHVSQLKRIKPTALENDSDGEHVTKYNLKDVRALSNSIQAAASSPSIPQSLSPSSFTEVGEPVDYDEEPHITKDDEVLANDDDWESDISSPEDELGADEEDAPEDYHDDFVMTVSMGGMLDYPDVDYDGPDSEFEAERDEYDDEYLHALDHYEEPGFYDNMDADEAELHFNSVLHG